MVELVLQHGWSFGSHFWRGWSGDKWARVTALNRGYCGEPVTTAPPPISGCRRVVVAHSFGSHLLTSDLLATADRLVLVSSFEGPLSEGMIARLADGIKRDPLAELASFDRLCGLEPQTRAELSVGMLLEDLNLMLGSILDLEMLISVPEIVVITGSRDRVIPSVLSKRLHRGLPGSRLLVVKDSGHGLPFLHPDICWEACQ